MDHRPGTQRASGPAAAAHLRGLLGNGLVLQRLEGLHGGVVSSSLSSLPFPKKLIVSYRQLNVKDLRHRAMIPKEKKIGMLVR